MKRRRPTLRERLAATLLTLVRANDFGQMVPVISFEEAKGMTADEIIARYEFDHNVYVAWGGSNHPVNLTPRAVADHREKTRRDLGTIGKVRRSERKRLGLKKTTPMLGSRHHPSGLRKRMSGKVEHW